VIGIADTNVDPELIEFPIPGNDDAIRSINCLLTWLRMPSTRALKFGNKKCVSQTDKASDLEKEKSGEAEPAALRDRRPGVTRQLTRSPLDPRS